VRPTEAACCSDSVRGFRRRLATGTAMRSAWLPSLEYPISPPVPHTSAPIQSAGPRRRSRLTACARTSGRICRAMVTNTSRHLTHVTCVRPAITASYSLPLLRRTWITSSRYSSSIVACSPPTALPLLQQVSRAEAEGSIRNDC